MAVYFRPHRFLLKEALEEEKEFENIDELKKYASTQTQYNLYGDKKYKNNSGVQIEFYAFDSREGIGTTYIITDGDYKIDKNKYGGVIGFAYLRDTYLYKKIKEFGVNCDNNNYETLLTCYKINSKLIENCSWIPIIEKLNKLGFENIYNDVYYCDNISLDLETGKVITKIDYKKETEDMLSILIQQNIIIKSND